MSKLIGKSDRSYFVYFDGILMYFYVLAIAKISTYNCNVTYPAYECVIWQTEERRQ